MLRYKCDTTSAGKRPRPIISPYGNLKVNSEVTYNDGSVWKVEGCFKPEVSK